MEFRLGSFEALTSRLRAFRVRRQLVERAMREPEFVAARLAAVRSGNLVAEAVLKRDLMERIGPPLLPGQLATLPCLLESCPPGHADHDWLKEALAALQDAGPRNVVLEACEAQPGPAAPVVLVARAIRVQANVARNDVVQGGFVLQRTAERGLELLPRLYRVACSNGAIITAGCAVAGAIEAAAVRAAIADMLSCRLVDAHAALLALAASRPVDDPLEILARARAVSDRAAVLHDFGRQPDRSVYGLLNAVTALARSTRSWVRRLEQEGDAGGILALLERGPDSRPRGAALPLPRVEEHFAVHA